MMVLDHLFILIILYVLFDLETICAGLIFARPFVSIRALSGI
jgi:hypothetical protein